MDPCSLLPSLSLPGSVCEAYNTSMDVVRFVKVSHGNLGDSEEDSALLAAMADEALDYFTSFEWCGGVTDFRFGVGVGKVIALFLLQVEPAALKGKPLPRSGEYVWVVVGDIPSAYLETDGIHDPFVALAEYCELMIDWADEVLAGGDLGECFPVRATASKDNARDLQSRIRTIRDLFSLPEVL